MHVASEPGDYVFKKSPQLMAASPHFVEGSSKDAEMLDIEEAMTVCGLYVVGEPDTIVEITMKHYDVNCETGALMAVSRSLVSKYK